jgi:hypothetical protein
MPKNPPLPLSVKCLRTIGGAGFLFGLAFVLITSPILFWWGTTFLYVAFVAIAIDLHYEPDLRRSPRLRRPGYLVVLVLACLFTWGIVMYPAKLQINSVSFEGLYKDGDSVYGIVWDDEMSDLRVDIYDPTDRDYDRLDLTIATPGGVMIRDQKQITSIPGVTLVASVHQVHFNQVEPDGKTIREHNMGASGYDQIRVLCDRLPKKATIGLILATSMQSEKALEIMGSLKNGLTFVPIPRPFKGFARKRAPTIRITGDFSVLNRPYTVSETYPVKAE